MRIAIVFVAGGLGCVLRYGVNVWVGERSFPWATLAVNAIGAFVIAFVIALALDSTEWRLALTSGLLGGFTTYSTFNQEALMMGAAGDYARAALYVTATVVGCLVAGMIGDGAARLIR